MNGRNLDLFHQNSLRFDTCYTQSENEVEECWMKFMDKLKEKKYMAAFSEVNLIEKIKQFGKKAGIKVIYLVLLLFYTLQKTTTPKFAKSLIVGGLGYFILPADFLPDLIPGIGFTDDLTALISVVVAVALFIDEGVKAKAQIRNSTMIGVITDSYYGNSRIALIDPEIESSIESTLFQGNSNLEIWRINSGSFGVDVTNNTFYREDAHNSSGDSSSDIRVIDHNANGYLNININNNNFINPDKALFVYTSSQSDDTLNLQSNFWRNLNDLEINQKIYDKTENNTNLSNVDISNILIDFNTQAPFIDYYFIDGFENNASYTTNITVDHNYRKAWINGVLFASGLLVKDEGKYTVKFEKDDSTILERVFYIDKTAPVISIGEYTTTPTNLDIVVNVSTNEGKLNTLSHTFSENGSFKFVATDDAGNVTEQLVTINNIDKTAPKVSGIEDKVTYSSKRTIIFNEGTATLNGQAFTSGTNVSTAGKYVLVVEDKAGNVTKVNFEIANPNPTTPSTPTEQNPTTQTTVTSPSSSAGTNNQISQTSYVEKLNDLTEILSDESVSNLVFTNLLKDIFNLNPDFISELDEVEQKALEDKILEVYESTLGIRVEGNSELKLEGYSFIDDLDEILKGSKIEVLVQVSEEINSTDQSLIDSYVSKNNLDSTMLYSIDLELFKSINGVEEKLSTLKQPVTITLPLPSKIAGVTDFTVIHVHEGTIIELPVIINGDGTFSFTTDKFSSFTLIDAAKLVPVIEEVEQSKNELNWLWGGSLVILIALAAYFIRKRSKIVG